MDNDANHDHVQVREPTTLRAQKGDQTSREPEVIMAQRRQLGAALATFRQAAELSQAQVGTAADYDRTSINKIERGNQLPDRPFWQAADRLLQAEGAVPASLRAADNDFAILTPPLPFPVTSYVDTAYLEAVQQHVWHIVELDNRFGGSDLARLAVRFFRSLHQQLGTGAYEPATERDPQATAGELAEVAGWLLYDTDRQDDVRRMNQEALYFSRLAGDRSVELLTLQNASMQAGHLGRPQWAYLSLSQSPYLNRMIFVHNRRRGPRL